MVKAVWSWWLKRGLLTTLGVLLMAALPALASMEEHRFRVFLDERPIGTHRFTVQADADNGLLVRSEAEFLVRVLLIPVYAYAHQAEERWVNGCLRQLDSETDANGDRYRVALSWQGDGYRIDSQDGSQRIDRTCLKSFAYWDKRFLDEEALINSQTGALTPVTVAALSEATPAWLPDTEPVVGYRIRTADESADIDVYYGRNSQRWLGLQSRLENDRVMRYVPDS